MHQQRGDLHPCAIQPAARAPSAAPQGWELFDDGRKPGLLTKSAGSVVELDIGQTNKLVSLAFLRRAAVSSPLTPAEEPRVLTPSCSRSMSRRGDRKELGMATIECVKGCTCDAVAVDGYWEQPVRVMQQRQFVVTASPECRLRVTSVAVRSGLFEPLHPLPGGDITRLADPPAAAARAQGKETGGTEFKLLAVVVGGRGVESAIGMGDALDLAWDLRPANFTSDSTNNTGRPDFGR